jgi:hypothetical protein
LRRLLDSRDFTVLQLEHQRLFSIINRPRLEALKKGLTKKQWTFYRSDAASDVFDYLTAES